jgi:hypothetical protein
VATRDGSKAESMSGCHWRYEDLPAHLKAKVDEVAGKKAEARRQKPGEGIREMRLAGDRRRPNKTEAAYRAEVLDRRGDAAAIHYEGMTLRMANGHRYTPDWVVVTGAGRVECHEVKGGYRLGSYQRARLAFDQVRVEFPWVVWVWAVRVKGGGWRVE